MLVHTFGKMPDKEKQIHIKSAETFLERLDK
jgi:hypothetical protein